jgi:hypothetical protein
MVNQSGQDSDRVTSVDPSPSTADNRQYLVHSSHNGVSHGMPCGNHLHADLRNSHLSSSTFFNWARSPAAREYFFSQSSYLFQPIASLDTELVPRGHSSRHQLLGTRSQLGSSHRCHFRYQEGSRDDLRSVGSFSRVDFDVVLM